MRRRRLAEIGVGVDGGDKSCQHRNLVVYILCLRSGCKGSGNWPDEADADKDVSLQSIFRCRNRLCADVLRPVFKVRQRSNPNLGVLKV